MSFTTFTDISLGYLNGIRLYHWTTKSFDEHLILNDLYDNLNEKIDEVAESLIANNYITSYEYDNYGCFNISEYKNSLDLVVNAIEYYSNLIYKNKKDRGLIALIDDIVNIFGVAKYKLEMLETNFKYKL